MCYFKENIRFAVLAFSAIFLLIGAALLAIGSIYHLTLTSLEEVIPESYGNLILISVLLIVAGSIIFLLPFIGFWAVACSKQKALYAYSFLLFINFLFLCSIGILSITFFQDEDKLRKSFNESVSLIFHENNTEVIDLLQYELHCCGVSGPNFWNQTMNLPIPESCCMANDCENIYFVSCEEAIVILVKEIEMTVEIAVFTFGAAELVGSLLTLCLVKVSKEWARLRSYQIMYTEN